MKYELNIEDNYQYSNDDIQKCVCELLSLLDDAQITLHGGRKEGSPLVWVQDEVMSWLIAQTWVSGASRLLGNKQTSRPSCSFYHGRNALIVLQHKMSKRCLAALIWVYYAHNALLVFWIVVLQYFLPDELLFFMYPSFFSYNLLK